MDDPRARWVQVFARLKPGQTVAIRAGAAAGAVHADPRARDDTAGREGLVGVFTRPVHEGYACACRKCGDRLFGPAQRLLDGADGADVHGGPGPAHRVRQCRQSADRARLHAPEGDRRPALARRITRVSSCASCLSRVWCFRSPAARSASCFALRSLEGCSRSCLPMVSRC